MAWAKVNCRVEVQMDPEDAGFAGAWYTAIVIHVDKGRYTVQYDEILTDDGDKDTDTVPLTRLRPVHSINDSMTEPLQERSCGEAVDCWYQDGWWEGYVHVTRDDNIVVFFPSNGDLVDVPLDQSDKPEEDQKRLRTRRKWSHKDRMWYPVERKVFDGGRDERTISQGTVTDQQPESKVSKDKFAEKQRELEAQRAKKKAAALPAVGSDTDSDGSAAEPTFPESEAEPPQPAGTSSQQGKAKLKATPKVNVGEAQQPDVRNKTAMTAATCVADKRAEAAGAAAAESDPLGDAATLVPDGAGAAADAMQEGAAAVATRNGAAEVSSKPRRPPAQPKQQKAAAPGAARTKKEPAAKIGATIVKAEPSEPQGTQKSRVAKKKEQAGAKPKKGAAPAQKDQPHIAEALKIIEEEGWEPLEPVKQESWSEEEITMMYDIESKHANYEDPNFFLQVRMHLALTLLPHRDRDSHRRIRSAHKNQLTDVRMAAKKAKEDAAGGKQEGPSRPLQPAERQQQRQQRQAEAAKVAAAQGPKPDTPGLDAYAKIGAGRAARGEVDSLPSTPRRADGKAKVTEIGAKRTQLAPTLAKLERRLSSKPSLGFDGLADEDAPATLAAMTSAPAPGPSDAAMPAPPAPARPAQPPPQPWRPTDPRLRVNQGEGSAAGIPESFAPMPAAAAAAPAERECGRPQNNPDGDVQMTDNLPPHIANGRPPQKARTLGRKRRSRSPDRRDTTPEVLPEFPSIKRPRTEDSGRASNIICLDGIGEVWRSNRELEAALRPFVADFTRVEIALEVVDGHPCHSGWAAVIFPSAQDAAEYLSTMQNLYIRTASNPLPRPLLAHYPTKSEKDFDKHIGYGFVQGIYIAPHFAQPNSIEYQPALEWRRLQRAARVFKRLQREDHTVKLANVMREYLQKTGADETSSGDQVLPPPPLKMPWLFVKGMGAPALADQQVIRSAFEQWGAREIRVPKDPVTGKTRGIALIRLQDSTQVELLKGDLDEMVYIMAGSPRLLESYMLDTGLPRECSQAVYDAALFQVFKRDDRCIGPPAASATRDPPPRLVKIDRPRSLEEWYAQRLRNLVERCAEEREGLQALLVGQRDALHTTHTRQYDGEVAKLVDANIINCTPIMKSIRTSIGVKKEYHLLRNVPDRYKYLLQYGNGTVGYAPGALQPGNNNQANNMAVGGNMTVGARSQANNTRNGGKQGRPYHGHRQRRR